MVRVEWGLVGVVMAATLTLVIAFALAKECLWVSSLEPSGVLAPGWREDLVLPIFECWVVFEYLLSEVQGFGLGSGRL
jgi:hypothetical protein